MSDERDQAKCRKCLDTGTVYESHGPGGADAVDCECQEAAEPADTWDDRMDQIAAASSGCR